MSKKPPEPMTMEELLALPVSIDLLTAARALGINPGEAYRLAQDGKFPCGTERAGGRWVVRRPRLFLELGLDPLAVAAVAVVPPEPQRSTSPEAA